MAPNVGPIEKPSVLHWRPNVWPIERASLYYTGARTSGLLKDYHDELMSSREEFFDTSEEHNTTRQSLGNVVTKYGRVTTTKKIHPLTDQLTK
ncbi:unnamed protein product [Danaus chrysippus]|uniref:(African queen) hypothetical protein n=1 Tax=Danaus chrysippus TaxID=151541 RepID=A0A8J2QT18_9NEOP|nr:unnamed protein product [Danaus chrysippus]